MARTRTIEAIRRANIDVPIPDYISLTESEADFWDRIVMSRVADDWTMADLELVAELCRSRALEKRVRDELDQGALMLAGKPHPLLAEASRCSAVSMKLVTALRLKTPAETRVLRGRASERTDFGNRTVEDDTLIPKLYGNEHDPSIPRLPIR